MAADDISSALTIVEKIAAAAVFIATVGGHFMWVKMKINAQDERNEKVDRALEGKASKNDLDNVKSDLKEVRENWVSRDYLDKRLEAHAQMVISGVLAAIGEDRRSKGR